MLENSKCLHVISFILLFILVGIFVTYAVEPVDYALFHNHTLNNTAKENNGRLDLVFIGASQTQRGFDPDIFAETLGLNAVFNASCGLQPMAASYYETVDLIRRFHPKHIVLDVNGNRVNIRDALQSNIIMLDRLHGRNKLSFIFDQFHGVDPWFRVLFKPYRYSYHATADLIRKNFKDKADLRNNNWSLYVAGPDDYRHNGFVYSYLTGEMKNNGESTFSADEIPAENMDYLNRIVRLCQKEGVRLTLVTLPTSMQTLYYQTNYQSQSDFFARYAKENGLTYHDLNLLMDRETYLPDEKMYDSGHVNGEGAEWVSTQYAEILRREEAGENTADAFYPNFEALKVSVHRVPALKAELSIQDGIAYIQADSRQNEGLTPLFKAEFSQNGTDFTDITDWQPSMDTQFNIREYRGSLTFHVCVKDSDDGQIKCAVFEESL